MHGLEWVYAPVELAHPLDDGPAVALHRSVGATAAGLGEDAAYRRLVGETARAWRSWRPRCWRRSCASPGIRSHWLGSASSSPLGRSPGTDGVSRRAGARALRRRTLDAAARAGGFRVVRARAPGGRARDRLADAQRGSQRIVDALAAYLRSLGGEIETGAPVEALEELPPARAVLCGVTPRQLLALAGDRLPAGYRGRLERYRYGPRVFKLDWALSGPIPWAAEECRRAACVTSAAPSVRSPPPERAPWEGRVADGPFVLLGQPSVFDSTRAPAGRHTAWAYCHVPNGWDPDETERVEAQVERFAPGFRKLVLARAARGPAELESENPNLVGGDLNGGVQDCRGSSSFGLRSVSTPTRPRCRGSSSARRRRHPAAECTGCAATGRRGRR